MRIVELFELTAADLWQKRGGMPFLFHGEVTRPISDDTPPLERNPFSTNSQRTPAQLVRSVAMTPDVICPRLNLMVTDRVRTEINSFPGIEFLPVEISRLIQFDENTFYDAQTETSAPDIFSLIDRAPNCGAEVPLPCYWEVIEGRLTDVDTPDDGVMVKFFDRSEGQSDEICLGPSLFERYASLYHGYSHFMSGAFFDALMSFVDFEYFHKREVEI